MGLYADGGDPFVVDSDSMAEEMAPAVLAWADAHIQIIDPQPKRTRRGRYNPVTDSWEGDDAPAPVGADPGVLWDSGPRGAIVQPVRASTLGDFGSQSTGLVAVRIQAAIPPEVDLRSGLQIKVLDGGSDHESERHTYVIGSGIDSSLRWVVRLSATVVTS